MSVEYAGIWNASSLQSFSYFFTLSHTHIQSPLVLNGVEKERELRSRAKQH